VRSINTTVVALLPIFAILVVGFTKLGPGTLLDLSLALFVGIAVGAYSSIFIATPLLVDLRRREPAVAELDAHMARNRPKDAQARSTSASSAAGDDAVAVQDRATSVIVADAEADADPTDSLGRPVHKWAATGPRQQPKRVPKSKR